MKIKILSLGFVTLSSVSSLMGVPVEFNLEDARKIADSALGCGQKNNWKFSVAIVNSEGNLMVFLRDDRSYSGSIEASIQKAKSANAFQRPTSVFVEGISKGRMGLFTVKDVVAIEGGVPIVRNGLHVGAIGVSGALSTQDDECAKRATEDQTKIP